MRRAPVLASHVGVKPLVGHPRNLSDHALEAIGSSGGVVHVVAFDSYLKEPIPERTNAILDLLSRNRRETVEQLPPRIRRSDRAGACHSSLRRQTGINDIGKCACHRRGAGRQKSERLFHSVLWVVQESNLRPTG